MSTENALKASRKVQLMSPKQPDSVLYILKNHGFNKAQISQLVSRYPEILKANAERTILPKLDFFVSIGVPNSVLGIALSYYPGIFSRSLSKTLIPSYNYVKSFVGTDAKVAYVFKRSPRLFVDGFRREVVENIAKLRDYGVPETSICFMFSYYPGTLMQRNDRFVKNLSKVIEMGFDSSKYKFVVAFQTLCDMKKSTIERKKKVYSRWGWSECDIEAAFLAHPICMSLSETKINSAMDFLINKMGFQTRAIAKSPVLLFYNLEKRIVPRCQVARALILKGLRKKETTHVISLLQVSNERFMEMYMTKYPKELPQLLDLYKGKVNITDLGFSAEELNQVKLH
ncbi:hypothetical protein Leryth_014124 [Lithospermum erythrorhizon]|nr:hypothetical protein Leryth_014124 [Lithospermum erythrorhizon]